MSLVALGLVLVSAVSHATWNFFAKRAEGGPAFVWLFDFISTLLYAPLALVVVLRPHQALTPLGYVFIVGSAVLHLAYFLMLQQGYRIGDLSLVYPLARGTGPMLSATAAIVFFGERPGPLAIGGAALIGVGTFVLAGGGGGLRGEGTRRAVLFALLTGGIIASYTLWDKRAVSNLAIPPLLLNWALGLGRVGLLAPYAVRHRAKIATVWRSYRREALVVATLSPLAYILVLTALTFTPVSYVAPAREISILIGVLLGTRFLAEGNAHRRIVAAVAMVLGVIGLALG
jgi:drug/metabolite transporter (DMT)-like permease